MAALRLLPQPRLPSRVSVMVPQPCSSAGTAHPASCSVLMNPAAAGLLSFTAPQSLAAPALLFTLQMCPPPAPPSPPLPALIQTTPAAPSHRPSACRCSSPVRVRLPAGSELQARVWRWVAAGPRCTTLECWDLALRRSLALRPGSATCESRPGPATSSNRPSLPSRRRGDCLVLFSVELRKEICLHSEPGLYTQ